ncbi:hypothetical protein L1D50_12605, partial [Pseudoalteromonas sp. Isolate6]|uniref:hypothetical protein n=1 Tax=Pseudoalteromonas sp. Isolate6 TaxID=2908527 RepID=UPI001EFD177C
DENNVIQNPLVCATRNLDENTFVKFHVDENYQDNETVQIGKLEISFPDFQDISLIDCLIKLKKQLLVRVPSLENEPLDQTLLENFKERFYQDECIDLVDNNENEESGIEVSFENSHIKEFWQEVICRIELLRIGNKNDENNEVLGFTKEAICSYLKPIVIVDGQHRLAGAIECSKVISENEKFDEVKQLMENGSSPELATLKVQKKYARELPISLLMSDNPEEHVFQFVVVNQKATPINKALLGTIVSTTLSDDELTKVTSRLKSADIPLDDSKAISMVTRREDSPFYGLVQTGIEKEDGGKLKWTVMKGLVSLFRDLKGGKYYSSEDKNDHVSNWSLDYLELSEIVAEDIENRTIKTWQQNDVWYDVFKAFWIKVRDHFGNTQDPEEHNYWGNTKSNLFNKVYLNILAVDFFSYMNDKERSIGSIEELEKIIDRWLDGTSPSYFKSDWGLEIKKDTPALRKQWNTLWVNYRKTPAARKRLPAKTEFSKF